MAYNLYAAPKPVPQEWREAMIGLRFDTQAEAFNRLFTLRNSGWFVYRLSGPDGFEMTESQVNSYYYERSELEAVSKSESSC